MAKFQVQLNGEWKDYGNQEDKILKRAFMAGFPCAKFQLRGQNYTYDFRRMVQINRDSGKERSIRKPLRWQAPSKPIVPPGPTTVITVPKGSPGTTIQVPHPQKKGMFIAIRVPASAKAGQAMLVPLPAESRPSDVRASESTGRASSAAESASGKASSSGWSTGGKVAAVAAVGGAAVGGAILGEHIAEHGLEATVDGMGDGLADAGEATADFAVDAGEFIVDATEDLGDFVMELF
jgi:hypothetical protein